MLAGIRSYTITVFTEVLLLRNLIDNDLLQKIAELFLFIDEKSMKPKSTI